MDVDCQGRSGEPCRFEAVVGLQASSTFTGDLR